LVFGNLYFFPGSFDPGTFLFRPSLACQHLFAPLNLALYAYSPEMMKPIPLSTCTFEFAWPVHAHCHPDRMASLPHARRHKPGAPDPFGRCISLPFLIFWTIWKPPFFAEYRRRRLFPSLFFPMGLENFLRFFFRVPRFGDPLLSLTAILSRIRFFERRVRFRNTVFGSSHSV